MWNPFRRQPPAPSPLPWPTYDMTRPVENPADYCGTTVERLEQVARTEIARHQAAADTARLTEWARMEAAAHDRRLRMARDDAQLRHTETVALETSRRHTLAGHHDDDLTAIRRAHELEEARHDVLEARRRRKQTPLAVTAPVEERPTGTDQDNPQDDTDTVGAHAESEWTDEAIAAQLRSRDKVPGIGAIATEFRVGKGKAERAKKMAQDARDASRDGQDAGRPLWAVGE